MTRRVFTDEPGKDFDANVRYDPLPGDARHHEQKPNELQRWTPKWGGWWDKPEVKEATDNKDAA